MALTKQAIEQHPLTGAARPMTPADEAAFIALWTEGLEIAVIAERLGRPARWPR